MRTRAATILAVGVLSAFGPGPARAQQPNANGPFGFWGQVIGASDRWVVVQNQEGKEYPVDLTGSIRVFLARWPTTQGRLAADSLVEVTGVRDQNNVVMTEHVDVFRGRARGLVQETMQPLVDTGRPLLNPGNIMMMNIFGPVYYLPPGEINQPGRVHIVGPVVNQVPLAVAQGGNVVFRIAPGPMVPQYTMTEVTPGSASMIKPGDGVFCYVTNHNTKSLVLEQLVLYKDVFLDQFVP